MKDPSWASEFIPCPARCGNLLKPVPGWEGTRTCGFCEVTFHFTRVGTLGHTHIEARRVPVA
jgi:hypothetical protein